jgi:uncharacterized protein
LSIKDQIANLEALAAADVELRRIEDRLKEDRGTLEAMKAELSKIEEKLGVDRSSLAEMDKTRGELMTDLRQMMTQVERSREKLSRSRNERESNAAQRELEELRKLQRDREEEINKLTTLSEAARKAIEDSEGQKKRISLDLGGQESDISKRLDDATREHKTKLAERERIAGTVAPSTLRRYEQVRKRKGTAIAKTIDGTCLSCHMRLPPMLFQKMMRGDSFEQCPSCARILYYEPPSESGQGETS